MTGLTSAMIAYDLDTGANQRLKMPLFYGYIKDGRHQRGRTFLLMTLISTLHNLSRSLGYAILAVVDLNLALKFFVGEVGAYLLYKLLRRDFYCWVRLEGVLSVILSLLERTLAKVITDFTVSEWGCARKLLLSVLIIILSLPQGCIHFRHPFELGGAAYCASMIWAQIMPFVALSFYDGGNKEQLETLLLGSFGIWLVLNGLFFYSIDRSYITTFFGTKTAPQYTVELFRNSEDDISKFDAAFDNRQSYINGIENEVRAWLAENIDRFILEQPEWWKIEMVGDEFLPQQAIEAEGGARRRRRSSVNSVREILGIEAS